MSSFRCSRGEYFVKSLFLLWHSEFPLHSSSTLQSLYLLMPSFLLSANNLSIYSSFTMFCKSTLVLASRAWCIVLVGRLKSLHSWRHSSSIMHQRVSSISLVANFLDDLTAVRDVIVEVTSQGSDVIVVVHSYGSIVGSSAIKSLTRQM
jgi:predicted ferric reductase